MQWSADENGLINQQKIVLTAASRAAIQHAEGLVNPKHANFSHIL
jgi:hypothetical protein